ncbi:MAG: hypothetical protein ACM3S1_16900 [Hyphomicrobiales bacterium]
MIFGVGGVTSLAGALVAGRAAEGFRLGRAVLVAQVAGLAGLGCVLAAQGPAWAAGGLLVASQCVSDPARAIAEINATALRQWAADEHALGRVNATFRVAELAATLLGAGLAALLAPALGLRATLAVAAVFALGSPLAIGLSPVAAIRHLRAQPATVSTEIRRSGATR